MVGRTASIDFSERNGEWVCVEVDLQRVLGADDLRARLMLAGPAGASVGACWRAARRSMTLPRRLAALSRDGALLLPHTPLHLLLPMQPILMITIPDSWKHGWSDDDSENEDLTKASQERPHCDQVDTGNTHLENLKQRALALLETCAVRESDNVDAASDASSGSSKEKRVPLCDARQPGEMQLPAAPAGPQRSQLGGPGMCELAVPRRRRRVRRRRRQDTSQDSSRMETAELLPDEMSLPEADLQQDVTVSRKLAARSTPRVIHAL